MTNPYTVLVRPYGNIEVIESARCRRISIKVADDLTLRLAAPPNTKEQEIVDYVRSHTADIDRCLDKQSEVEPIVFTPETVFKTRFHTLSLKPEATDNRMRYRLEQQTLSIQYPRAMPAKSKQLQDFVRKAIDATLKKEAEQYLPQRVKELSEKTGLKYSDVEFRNMTSRWGSCTTDGRIHLNVQLMRLPDHLIDMVILHELNHIRHIDDNDQFWEDLNALCNGKIDQLEAEIKSWRTTY